VKPNEDVLGREAVMVPAAGKGLLLASFRVGGLAVTHLSDGHWQRPQTPGRNWFAGVPDRVWMDALGVSDPNTPFSVNFGGFVVAGDGHVTLVDCGWGARRGRDMPGLIAGGSMIDQLGRLGIRRRDVDKVVLTHLHSDHCGHLVDDADGNLGFPDATVYVHAAELAYWQSAEADGSHMTAYVRSRVTPVIEAGRLETFDGEMTLSRAITVIPTPGHTPGHTSVMVTSEGECVLLLGDVAHHAIHLEHHDWLPEIDMDPAESVRSRVRMASLAAASEALVTAPHMPILTLGRVRGSVSTGFQYCPVSPPSAD
jgi:glyoxylase-like metal-dependent hydrolase (beta-lactamase superfamily II)